MVQRIVFGEPGDPRKWVQCANAICERIADGRYRQGEWLPDLAKLCAELGTSHAPVQRAREELRAQGLISRVSSAGYYIGSGEPPPAAQRSQGAPPPVATGKARGESKKADSGDLRSAFLGGEQYITAKELATLLRTSVMTVYRVIYDGEIDGVIRLGDRMFRIPVSSAQAYLKRRVIDPAQLNMQAIAELGEE